MKKLDSNKTHITIQFTHSELESITDGLFEFLDNMEINITYSDVKKNLTKLQTLTKGN